jgi:predicted transcriptional regulator
MSTKTISFRIDEKSAKVLDKLAETTDRAKAWHLEQALSNYLQMHRWQLDHIERSRKQIANGEGIPHEEVMATMRRRIARDRKKRA